ncbi:PhzF family phenazine biosynthesis protein [Microcoleus sp. FACHB-68]|uniref:PhzF family phenazine biosynthesis protein n=1 Tax=Microcoleus sp. FACHB-68 TaxID=2692826 RepID=UPI001687AA36|nr:PhzF family phenazine biosynthesis protein [Microcoleus sp. FACHB-68]MBD1937190.1 PhzF family phenazine biosynthesis protein [Microcoleus sp. FACHB-68]
MGKTLIQVDAFTNKRFSGNPAAVCVLNEPADEKWMQNVAAEMNLSETAFLYPQEEGYNLRWFTPAVEVDLCGHATLASAHVLWELQYLDAGTQAKFYTRSGLLTAERQGNWIELNFPKNSPEPASAPGLLEQALGVELKYVGKNKFDYLVEVDSEEALRQMQPDFVLLKTLPVRGIIVTCVSASHEYDFVSRFFAPAAGINEDPVTGSAHCCLAPFWSQRLHKNEFVAYQASARGGVVRVRLAGERVYLGGQAVTVLRGELT